MIVNCLFKEGKLSCMHILFSYYCYFKNFTFAFSSKIRYLRTVVGLTFLVFYSLFPEDSCLVVEELVISNQRKGVKDCKLYIDALILLLLWILTVMVLTYLRCYLLLPFYLMRRIDRTYKKVVKSLHLGFDWENINNLPIVFCF